MAPRRSRLGRRWPTRFVCACWCHCSHPFALLLAESLNILVSLGELRSEQPRHWLSDQCSFRVNKKLLVLTTRVTTGRSSPPLATWWWLPWGRENGCQAFLSYHPRMASKWSKGWRPLKVSWWHCLSNTLGLSSGQSNDTANETCACTQICAFLFLNGAGNTFAWLYRESFRLYWVPLDTHWTHHPYEDSGDSVSVPCGASYF